MNKTKEIIRNILVKNYLYIIGVILFTYKGLLLNFMLGMTIGKEMYLITAAIPMLLLVPVIGSKKKFAFIYTNIAYAIITLLIFANYIYYNYSTNFLSVYQIENLKYGKEIALALDYMITLKNITIFWLDNIILLLLPIFGKDLFKKLKRGTKSAHGDSSLSSEEIETNGTHSQEKEIDSKKRKYYKFIFLFLVIILNIVLMQTKIERTYRYYTYNKTLMVKHISIYYYHFEDIKEYYKEIFYKEKIDVSKIEDISKQNTEAKRTNEELYEIAGNNNVIILQLESLNSFIIDQKVNGKEITPNLNKFYRENIYFPDMYNQGLGTTADSEHAFATSLYPLENGRVFQKYYNNQWDDLYSILKENGYSTSFMHPNVSTFWNRYAVYNKGYHIDEYNDISQFIEKGEFAGEFFSDENFLEQSVEILKTYSQPFCTMLVSVTAHIPYELYGVSNLEEKLSIHVENIEDEEFKNYLLSCNFVDYSFGVFLQRLKEANLLENSILIVYGDHGAGLSNKESIESLYIENGKAYNRNIEKLQDTHVPFGMKVSGLSKIKINNTVSKIDVKPTILNLLGIEDKFSMGEDLFGGKDYSYIKGIGFVTSSTFYIDEEYIDRKTNQIIQPDENLIYLTNKMNDDIWLSDIIIRNNLFKTLLTR